MTKRTGPMSKSTSQLPSRILTMFMNIFGVISAMVVVFSDVYRLC